MSTQPSTPPSHPQNHNNLRNQKRRYPKSRVPQVMWFLIAMVIIAAIIRAM